MILWSEVVGGYKPRRFRIFGVGFLPFLKQGVDHDVGTYPVLAGSDEVIDGFNARGDPGEKGSGSRGSLGEEYRVPDPAGTDVILNPSR